MLALAPAFGMIFPLTFFCQARHILKTVLRTSSFARWSILWRIVGAHQHDHHTGTFAVRLNNTNCGKYDHIRAFTVETPRRGVSTEFMIVSKAIGIMTRW